MPFILLLFGAVLFVAGVRGTNKELWALVKSDFTGNKSFLLWVAAIAIVGGAGYIKPLKELSVAFMTLLLVVLFLSNKGVVSQLQSFVNNPTSKPVPTPTNDNATGTDTTYMTALTPIHAMALNQ